IKVTGSLFYDRNNNEVMDEGEGKQANINFTILGVNKETVFGNGTYEVFLEEGKDYMAIVDIPGFVSSDSSWRISPS
ncbi:MAG: hypothetical protein QXT63_00255, partial [Thermoplasmata archaeon]